jgi:transposase-like protein
MTPEQVAKKVARGFHGELTMGPDGSARFEIRGVTPKNGQVEPAVTVEWGPPKPVRRGRGVPPPDPDEVRAEWDQAYATLYARDRDADPPFQAVATEMGVDLSTLRRWRQKFQLKTPRRPSVPKPVADEVRAAWDRAYATLRKSLRPEDPDPPLHAVATEMHVRLLTLRRWQEEFQLKTPRRRRVAPPLLAKTPKPPSSVDEM